MTDTVIKATNLCCKSGKRFLLNNINWEVKKGEHWVIFGMNGSGKTTLLSTVAGFKSPTSGDLEVFGQMYTAENILNIRQRIGWVSSSFFDKYLTRESALNVVLSGLFGTLSIGWDVKDADVRRAKALLCELRMKDKMNKPFDMMSKGERQNVLIARALISRPEILVLDEPGTGLDVYAREHMMNTVRELASGGDVTILYVTHYPEEIQPLFTKTMLLRYGRIYAQGNTEEVITTARISALMDEAVTVDRAEDGYMRMRMEAPSNIRSICYDIAGGVDHE